MKNEKKKWKSFAINPNDLPSIYDFIKKPLEAGFWCLLISKRNFNRDYLTAEDIENILLHYLDIKIKAIQVKRAFARAGNKIIKTEEGYKISHSGEEYLKSLHSRKTEQRISGPNFQGKNSQLFDNRKLHKSVVSVSKKLFYDGHYSQAIFEACKSLNKKVQDLSNLLLDGKQLMLSAFSVGNPKLKFNQLRNQSDKDEQEGFMHIFAGLMQGIRNPKGHEIVNLKDPYRALEYLGFISLLFRKLDELK